MRSPKNDLDVGHVSGVAHWIELIDHLPFKERTRRASPCLLASEIIEESVLTLPQLYW